MLAFAISPVCLSDGTRPCRQLFMFGTDNFYFMLSWLTLILLELLRRTYMHAWMPCVRACFCLMAERIMYSVCELDRLVSYNSLSAWRITVALSGQRMQSDQLNRTRSFYMYLRRARCVVCRARFWRYLLVNGAGAACVCARVGVGVSSIVTFDRTAFHARLRATLYTFDGY